MRTCVKGHYFSTSFVYLSQSALSLQPLDPAPTVTGSGRATRRDVNPHANTMSGIYRGFLPKPTLRPSASSQINL